MILFLNKKDLFMEKIQRVNITTAFPDYEGGNHLFEIKLQYKEFKNNIRTILIIMTGLFSYLILTSKSFISWTLSKKNYQLKYSLA